MRNFRKQRRTYFIFIASIILFFPTILAAEPAYKEELFSKRINDDICYVIKESSVQNMIDEISRHKIDDGLMDVLSSLQCRIRLPNDTVIRRSVLRMVIVESGAPGSTFINLIKKTRSSTFDGWAWLDSQIYSEIDDVTLFQEIRRAYNHREDFPDNRKQLLIAFRVLCAVLKKSGRFDVDENSAKECKNFGLMYKAGGKIPDQI